MNKALINVEGKDYVVTDNLGFQSSHGCYAKMVATEMGERVALKQFGCWSWAKPIVIPTSGYVGQKGE